MTGGGGAKHLQGETAREEVICGKKRLVTFIKRH